MSKLVIAMVLSAGVFSASICQPAQAQDTKTQQDDKQTAKPEEKIPAWTGPKDDKEKTAPGEIDKEAPTKFKETKTGLRYRILRAGDKNKMPKAENSVTVHYKGWLDNKKIFDSSYRRGEKISFPLGRVIKGWTEGLQLVGEGGMIELEIPSKLGYGERGAGSDIPPNATLHFLVELYEIK